MSDTPSSPFEPTPLGPGEGDPTPLTPDSGAPGPTSVPRASWRSWAAAGGVAAVVIIGGVVLTRHRGSGSTADAAAATSNGSGQGQLANRGAIGKITSIKGSTLTIDAVERGTFDANGNGTTNTTTTTPVTVKTNRSTTYSEMASGSVGDLKKGDAVLVMGTADGSTVAAANVVEGDQGLGFGRDGGDGGTRRLQGVPPQSFEGAPPQDVTPPTDASGQPVQPGQDQGPGGGITAGTIASVAGDSFTVTQRDGTQTTVTTSSSTKVSVTKEIGLGDLKVGDAVVVTGDRSGDTVTASAIRKGDGNGALGFGFGGPGRLRRDGSTSTTAATS